MPIDEPPPLPGPTETRLRSGRSLGRSMFALLAAISAHHAAVFAGAPPAKLVAATLLPMIAMNVVLFAATTWLASEATHGRRIVAAAATAIVVSLMFVVAIALIRILSTYEGSALLSGVQVLVFVIAAWTIAVSVRTVRN